VNSIDLKGVKKAYFLGIGGIGVSAIARMFLLEGKAVSGSDTADSDLIQELRAAGAEVAIGNDVSHIPLDTDLVVYTIAIHGLPQSFLLR